MTRETVQSAARSPKLLPSDTHDLAHVVSTGSNSSSGSMESTKESLGLQASSTAASSPLDMSESHDVTVDGPVASSSTKREPRTKSSSSSSSAAAIPLHETAQDGMSPGNETALPASSKIAAMSSYTMKAAQPASCSMSSEDSGQGHAPSSTGSISSGNGQARHAVRKTAGTLRGSGRTNLSMLGSHLASPSQRSAQGGDGDTNSIASTRSLSQNDDDDDWESDSIHATDMDIPPEGAEYLLPSIPPLRTDTARERDGGVESVQRRRNKSTTYDWASFAYAYARGQWDPTRIPRPPGRSSIVPDTETRIRPAVFGGDSGADGPHGDVAPAETSGGPRRPSLDYRALSSAHAASHSQEVPPSVTQTMSRSAREINRDDLDQGNHDEPSLLRGSGPKLPPQVADDSSGNYGGPRSLQRQAVGPTTLAHGRGEAIASMEEALQQTDLISPFEILAKANNSAPDVERVVQAAKLSEQRIRHSRQMRENPHSGGSHSDPLLTTKKSLRSDEVTSLEWPVADWPRKSWSARASNEDIPRRRSIIEPPSTIAPLRPSLAAQTSSLSAGASHTSRGSDQSLSNSGNQDGLLSPQRPELMPLQISDFIDDRKSSSATIQQDSEDNFDASMERDKAVIRARHAQEGESSKDGAAPSEDVRSVKFSDLRPLTPDKVGSIDGADANVNSSLQIPDGNLHEQGRFVNSSVSKLNSWDPRFQHTARSPSLSSYVTAGRQLEDFYNEHGYLRPVFPPDEHHRRQVLRRYGPSHMQGFHDFERVAELVKVVFNVPQVYVNLVAADDVDVKAHINSSKSASVQMPHAEPRKLERACTFSGHVILQRSAEPLVVLDTAQDWRFACSPMATGDAKIRFYAGCPLRTPDGFNLGSLCISDEKPRTEFGPRQRHTLKEFARLVMRELELVRDTLHLRIRDRMQHSIEHFTRQSIEMDSSDSDEGPGIHEIYRSAVESMRQALRATGAVMFDLTQFEAVVTANPDGTEVADGTGRIFLPSPYHFPDVAPLFAKAQQDVAEGASHESTLSRATAQARVDGKLMPAMPILGSSVIGPPLPASERQVSLAHHIKIADFLQRYRQGHYFSYVPAPFRELMPPGASNVLLVPIFGLNRQPFALLCAYSRASEGDVTLEDIQDAGLQYLRAMGTIILSAVLKKDIMMADQAKSHFISNISHELRTPLHGILAAAELMNETNLSSTQTSYLDTVEACGKSLLELVNHVLDFTKLSGGTQSKAPAVKPLQKCDLIQLVQEVCESSWIGQMAKNLDSARHAGIGSAYAKGSEASSPTSTEHSNSLRDLMGSSQVETVIDVSMRSQGWFVKCDAGGIRRVLMNLIGNSLKFTNNGFVHVAIREVQSDATHIIVELSVTDTGKGISRTFLEEQLFHPFTQENHLGPGTGLGLSIVNSIVQSPAINGKIDVWSTQGHGTEIRVTCELEICPDDASDVSIYRPRLNLQHQRSIAFVGFAASSRGASDLKDVMRTYFEDWWRFRILTEDDVEDCDLILLNDNIEVLEEVAHERTAPLPPVILLSSLRGSTSAAVACERYQSQGGVVRTIFKPTGPARLEQAAAHCLQCFERGHAGEDMLPRDLRDLPSPSNTEVRGHSQEQGSRYMIDNAAVVEDDAVTPRGAPAFAATDSSSQKSAIGEHLRPPLRPTLSNEQRRDPQHHISPGPPRLPETLLVRRPSAARSDDGVLLLHRRQSEGEGSDLSADGTASVGSKGTNESVGKARPGLPPRSVTYHEPRLRRQVLLSPLRSPHAIRDHGEAQDYFGPTAVATTPVQSRGAAPPSTSSPSTPGSVISLEGGDGAILKTAINTAGIVRPLHGPVAQKKRLQILSVEDNSINRRVLAAFFDKMEVDFVEATNGEEGVQQFESHPPFFFDVIFMDLSMPILDGIGATLRIRQLEAERFRSEQVNSLAWLRGSRQHIPTSLSLSSSKTSSSTEVPASVSIPSTSSAAVSKASSSSSSSSAKHQPSVQTSPLILHTPGGSRPSLQARAKIFALTGRSGDDDKRRAFSAGADGFIVKPLSFKVLSSLLNNVNAYR